MTKRTLYALGLFITLLLGTFLFQRLCSDCRTIQNSGLAQETVVPIPSLQPFTFHERTLKYSAKDVAAFHDASTSISANSCLKQPSYFTGPQAERKQRKKHRQN